MGGNSLLDMLKKWLFKSLGSIFDSALQYKEEYEEEDGVVKQTWKFDIMDSDENVESLIVKLSPVKDKPDIFYVEIETKAADFDSSVINKKTVKIDSNSAKERFNELIGDMIKDNGYKWLDKDGNPIDEPDEESGEESDEEGSTDDSDLTKEEEQEVEEMEDKLEDEISSLDIEATDENGETVKIELEVVDDKKIKKCTLSIKVIDESGESQNYPKETYECDTVDEDNNPLKFSVFYNNVKSCVKEYAAENGLAIPDSVFGSEQFIDAQFIKASDDSGVELTAINTTRDIKAAIEAIEEIAESDDFVNLLGPEPKSFRITEDDNEYDINEIEDDVDTSGTYDVLFRELSIINSTLKSYQWAVGDDIWYSASNILTISNILEDAYNTTARWIQWHTNHYAIPVNFDHDNTLPEIKGEDGEVSIELLNESVKRLGQAAVDLIDGYYVNLLHDEQNVADDWISRLKEVLTYAAIKSL